MTPTLQVPINPNGSLPYDNNLPRERPKFQSFEVVNEGNVRDWCSNVCIVNFTITAKVYIEPRAFQNSVTLMRIAYYLYVRAMKHNVDYYVSSRENTSKFYCYV